MNNLREISPINTDKNKIIYFANAMVVYIEDPIDSRTKAQY